MPTTHDPFDVLCGDDWLIPWTVNDDDDAPLDLDGASISWRLDSIDNSFNALSLSLGSGITITDAVGAAIQVDVLAAQSITVKPGMYLDWLQVTLADGSVST